MRFRPLPQGPRSFRDFGEYHNEWIQPHLMRDLKTIFEGAKARWIADGSPAKGRGDYLLAIPLFAIFDHLGAFLAPTRETSLEYLYNIARTVKLLPSIKDIPAIMANLGRNALVHGCWPQSNFPMGDRTWSFGLNMGANPDEDEHNILYTHELPLGDPQAGNVTVLKLVQNVHVLRKELDEIVNSDVLMSVVKPHVFRRVRRLSTMSGRPGAYGKAFGGTSDWSPDLWGEIETLQERAKLLRVWDHLDTGCKRTDPNSWHCRMPWKGQEKEDR